MDRSRLPTTRRLGRLAAIGGCAALLATACAPFWATGTPLYLTGIGADVLVTWGEADEIDGDAIDHYDLEVDGVPVAVLGGGTTQCLLTGVAGSTTIDVAVTATDTAAESSAPLGGDQVTGTLEASYTTPAGGAGGTLMCTPTTDTDGDRLPDAYETDTGTFADASDTGTDPSDPDTDDDGIPDGDEVLGTDQGLDLPGMGVSPLRADLLFEYDWFDDNADPGTCGAHSHRPTPAVAAEVTATFASAPTANPDGSTGINVVHDYGQGGLFTGGNLIADADGVIAGGVNGADFGSYKADNFHPMRKGYFHYVLLPHRYNTTSSSSGQAELPGDDLIVSLYCYGTTGNVANTILHEVGHNLDLRHGGDENRNRKPNYNSLMNYDYQFPGVDANCTPPGDGVRDFSHGTRADLDENALVEADGICGGVPWDWNGSSAIDGGTVSVNLNPSYDSIKTVLHDHDDWAAIDLTGPVTDGDGASLFLAEPEIITEQPVPASARIVPEG